jgi:hypothetical protein
MRQARAEDEADVQAVADGTADPRVYAALDRAYEAADASPEDRHESARQYAVSLIVDAFQKSRRARATFDPGKAGTEAAAKINATNEMFRTGGVFGSLRRMMSRDPVPLGAIQTDLADARRVVPPPVQVTGLKALVERSEHQADALDRLTEFAAQEAADRPLLVRLTVVTAVAAVIAAVVGIAALAVAIIGLH